MASFPEAGVSAEQPATWFWAHSDQWVRLAPLLEVDWLNYLLGVVVESMGSWIPKVYPGP